MKLQTIIARIENKEKLKIKKFALKIASLAGTESYFWYSSKWCLNVNESRDEIFFFLFERFSHMYLHFTCFYLFFSQIIKYRSNDYTQKSFSCLPIFYLILWEKMKEKSFSIRVIITIFLCLSEALSSFP